MNVVQTERLKILPFETEFITDRYINWLNDPEVVKFSEQRFTVHTRKTCMEYLLTYAESPNLFWAIFECAHNYGHIGNINAIINSKKKEADIGILIGEKQLWGRGYGSEAWQAICDFLLEKHSIQRITAGTSELNKGMQKIFLKSGMTERKNVVTQEMTYVRIGDHCFVELKKS